MASIDYLLHYFMRLQQNHFDIAQLVSGFKGSGKSNAAIYLARRYLEMYSFICPKCGNNFFKNVYAIKDLGTEKPSFSIPNYINDVWIKCPILYKLDKTDRKVIESGCDHVFHYSQRKRIKWEASRFIAYDNKDVIDKLYNSPQHWPIVIDEAMNVIAAQNHNRTEVKFLKQLLTVVRPRRYILFFCVPEASWVDSKVREGMSSFWLRMVERGVGIMFEKDKGEVMDKYHVKDMAKMMGTVKFFTPMAKIKRNLKKHPCYFSTFKFPPLPEKVYDEYELVRNQLNLQRQVEEMELSNKDIAKMATYNLIRNWDRVKISVDKSRDSRLTYEILTKEILVNPVTRQSIASDVTARNWVRGVEEFIKSRGKQAQMFDGQVGDVV